MVYGTVEAHRGLATIESEVGVGSLERLGYTVLIADGGVDALKVYEENAGSVNLVLLDLMMPDMDGKEVLRKLKERSPALPVIISSGYSPDETVEALQQLGADGFVPNPYRLAGLSRTLAKVLGAVS